MVYYALPVVLDNLLEFSLILDKHNIPTLSYFLFQDEQINYKQQMFHSEHESSHLPFE